MKIHVRKDLDEFFESHNVGDVVLEGDRLLFVSPDTQVHVGIRVGPENTRDESGPIWGMTGFPDNITITPSIQCHGASEWHGWIRNGEMIDA